MERSLLRFGLFADVQAGDKEPWRGRNYREALGLLSDCLDAWAQRKLDFAVQLGDLIDGADTREESRADLDAVFAHLQRFPGPWFHIVGNHCLALPRDEVLQRLGRASGWMAHSSGGWRFVFLDSVAFARCGRAASDPVRLRAEAWLEAHPKAEHPRASDWNGGFGEEQLAWLREQLREAEAKDEAVLLFSHNPVLAEAADEAHLAWDAEALLAVIDDFAGVRAFLSGHHHPGGYAFRRGVHHLGVPAMVEAPPEGAWAIVTLRDDRIEIDGRGSVRARTLPL